MVELKRGKTMSKVYQAIAQVQAAIAKNGIAKLRRNAQQGYPFRGIDDVYNELSPHLSAAGLCILPRVISREVVERQSTKGGALFYVTVAVEFDLVCAEDGSKHTVKTYGEAMDSADKATNKAMSAAYKYMAMEVFCIPTEGDNDADASTPEVSSKITAKQLAELTALIDDVGANTEKFLGFLKVDALENLPAVEFDKAKKALEAKRKSA